MGGLIPKKYKLRIQTTSLFALCLVALVARTSVAETSGECAELTDAETIDQVNTARQEGERLFRAKRYSAAIEQYKTVIGLDPCAATTYYNLGLAHNRLRNTDEALTALKRAVELEPGHLNARLNIASALLRNKSLPEAAATYSEIRGLAGDDDEVMAQVEQGILSVATQYLRQANASLKARRYDDAIASCNLATSLNPDLAKAHIIAGKAYLKKKSAEDLEMAQRRFWLAMEATQDSSIRAAALQGLGNVMRNRGNSANRARRRTQAQRQWRSAIDYYEKAMALDNSSLATLINSGDIYVRLERYREAIGVLERAVTIDNRSRTAASAYGKLAESHNALNQCPDAESAARSAISIKRSNPSAYVALGEALLCQNKNRDARSAFVQASRDRRWKDYAEHQIKQIDDVGKTD